MPFVFLGSFCLVFCFHFLFARKLVLYRLPSGEGSAPLLFLILPSPVFLTQGFMWLLTPSDISKVLISHFYAS